MSRLITNKDKQKAISDSGEKPNKSMKSLTTKKLRLAKKNVLNDQISEFTKPTPGKDSMSDRKKSGICPVCLTKLKKNEKRTRYERCCHACGSVLQNNRICFSCGTSRVWVGKSGAICKGCGKKQING
jgi:hypothetical protein